MPGTIIRNAICLLMLICTSVAAADDAAPAGLRDYDVTQYVSIKSFSPETVMYLDNNDEILMACREGRTREQLDAAGIDCLDSQLVLLRAWRLLDKQDGVYTSRLPILGPQRMTAIRATTREAAATLLAELRPDFAGYVGTLAAAGFADNAFSVLFSYVVDGLVWYQFRQRDRGVSTQVTAEMPLWAGAIWAVYPARASRCGTNQYTVDNGYISLNWSEAAHEQIGGLTGGSDDLRALAAAVRADGRVVDPALRDALLPYRLVAAYGRPLIPVITESATDPLHAGALALSGDLADRSLAVLPLDDLQAELGLDDPAVALIIVYHELMWDLMEMLEADGLVERPCVLSGDPAATPADIGKLAFIVLGE